MFTPNNPWGNNSSQPAGSNGGTPGRWPRAHRSPSSPARAPSAASHAAASVSSVCSSRVLTPLTCAGAGGYSVWGLPQPLGGQKPGVIGGLGAGVRPGWGRAHWPAQLRRRQRKRTRCHLRWRRWLWRRRRASHRSGWRRAGRRWRAATAGWHAPARRPGQPGGRRRRRASWAGSSSVCGGGGGRRCYGCGRGRAAGAAAAAGAPGAAGVGSVALLPPPARWRPRWRPPRPPAAPRAAARSNAAAAPPSGPTAAAPAADNGGSVAGATAAAAGDGPLVCKCKGLPVSATTDKVADFFAPLRIAPSGIKLQSNAQGVPSGECYVLFADEAALQGALERTKKVMGHRFVTVERASPEEARKVFPPPAPPASARSPARGAAPTVPVGRRRGRTAEWPRAGRRQRRRRRR